MLLQNNLILMRCSSYQICRYKQIHHMSGFLTHITAIFLKIFVRMCFPDLGRLSEQGLPVLLMDG